MITVSMADFMAIDTTPRFPLWTPCKAKQTTEGVYPQWVAGRYLRLTANFAIAGAPAYAEYSSGLITGDALYDENTSGSPGQHWCLGAVAYSAAINASSTNYYGFIQTYGLSCAAMTFGANTTAGELVFPSSTDGTWSNVATLSGDVVTTTSTTLWNIGPLGFVLADDDSSNVVAAGKIMLFVPTAGPDAIPQV